MSSTCGDAEQKFCQDLYQKANRTKKEVLSKNKFSELIENLKNASMKTSHKSRREFYLLERWVLIGYDDWKKNFAPRVDKGRKTVLNSFQVAGTRFRQVLDNSTFCLKIAV